MNSIRCRACGAANDLTAISCARCGASLVDETSDRWGVAQERIAARGALVEERTERRRSRLIVIGTVLAVAAVLVGGYYTHDTLQRNYYLMGEPLYDNQPAAYWTVRLPDDHHLRRRGAQALDSLADKVNAATAKTIIPDLTEALNDEDEVVRWCAASASARSAEARARAGDAERLTLPRSDRGGAWNARYSREKPWYVSNHRPARRRSCATWTRARSRAGPVGMRSILPGSAGPSMPSTRRASVWT